MNLKKKAQKAWFSIRSTLISNKITDTKLSLKLFEALVRPILLYGAEIWCQDFQNCIDFKNNKFEKCPFEMLQSKVCRNILGVRKNTSSKAARAELGTYPILVFISKLVMSFYNKTIENPSKLSHHALISEIELDNRGVKSWATLVKQLLELQKEPLQDDVNLGDHIDTSEKLIC